MHPPLLPRAAAPLGRRVNQLRAYSTPHHSISMPGMSPESPDFIPVPQAPKPTKAWKPAPKGFIPAPRKIFEGKGPSKSSWYYIARATPPNTKPLSGPAPKNRNHPSKVLAAARVKWKRDMAESRKKNFREGILELAARHRDHEKKRKEVSERRMREREEKLAAKEKDDVRLTLPTVLSSIKETYPIQDPRREQRIAAAKKKLEKLEARKKLEQQELVHDLYVNARDFIVTEEHLDRVIGETFKESHTLYGNSANIPPSIMKRLQQKVDPTPTDLAGAAYTSPNVLSVAGALTGGKLVKKAEVAKSSRI